MLQLDEAKTIWAIGDLHLSVGLPPEKQKPMDIFDEVWKTHEEKIRTNWLMRVEEDDAVLLAGDLFWGLRLEETGALFEWLDALPGRKILVQGNHDYWWESPNKLRAALPKGMFALSGDALRLGDVAIFGTRGFSGEDALGEAHKEKMLHRETLRLERALAQGTSEDSYRIALTHYPPMEEGRVLDVYAILGERYMLDAFVFGHLHGKERRHFAPQKNSKIKYDLISADCIDFSPKTIYNSNIKYDR